VYDWGIIVLMKYRIYFTNFGYYSQDEFDSLELAQVYARSKSFQSQIVFDGVTVMTWCPISGFRSMI
jgi:hypothetical protein